METKQPVFQLYDMPNGNHSSNDLSVPQSDRKMSESTVINMQVVKPSLKFTESSATIAESQSNDEMTNGEEETVQVKPKRSVVREDSVFGPLDGLSGCYFSDLVRKVDFVLAYEKTKTSEIDDKRRQFFEKNIQDEGLEIEVEEPDENSRDQVVFVKIHAPWSVLSRQAELMKLKMPLKITDSCTVDCKKNMLSTIWKRVSKKGKAPAEKAEPTVIVTTISAHFTRKKMDRFNIADKEHFFSDVQRIELVWEVLQTARNDPNDEKKRGIETLIDKHVYEGAYPPHDGDDTAPKDLSPSYWSQRQMLEATWASWRNAFKKQPLESIRKYFGEKISFYFAFLGFYTKWLSLPALGGFFSFIYGLGYTGDDDLVSDFCDGDSAPGNYTMCPICDPPNCHPFMLAEEGCWMVKWDYRMDNEATLALACISVVWATIFIKMWKRREAELAFEWDTHDLDIKDVLVRPEYEEMATQRRENPVTKEMEPYVPKSTRLFWHVISTAVTMLMLTAVAATLGGLVIFRIFLYGAIGKTGGSIGHHSVDLSRWSVHGLIFVFVVLFEKVYHGIALKLTSWECPKTQAQYMSSFLWKLFLFELVNDFVPIAYAAWFKGKMTSTPLDMNFTSELCDAGGCLFEAFELISVLLMARLLVGNMAEVGIPFMQNMIGKCWREKKAGSTKENLKRNAVPQYRKDFELNELELDGVAEEYMEMIVQFAFVTLFVPVFPLAALVCFLNNIAEIRVDAINFVSAHRRPLPMRVPGIQIWNKFLDLIAKLAILVNAALIAFTSDLIPRLYFKYHINQGKGLMGYGQFSLSSVHIHEFGDKIHHWLEENPNVTKCYYQDFREEHDPYERKEIWWIIMLLRVSSFSLFVVIFYTLHWLFNTMISDVPSHVETKIRRRKFVIMRANETEIVYDKWLKKGQQKANVWKNGVKKRSAIVTPQPNLGEKTPPLESNGNLEPISQKF